jgi:hypothetical protein
MKKNDTESVVTKSNVNRETLVQNIQKWVYFDNQLKKINEKARECREWKSKLSTEICRQLQERQMEKTKIDISDGTIRVYDKNEYSPLSFSYVEECLAKIIPEKSSVDYIIQYLKEHREIKRSQELRRTFRSTTLEETEEEDT